MIDDAFVGKVITPGLIAQHDHPLLTGLTMVSEIIAIEDWVLPSGVVPAATSPAEYRARLEEANAKLKSPSELLVTWGYHQVFHGPLTRADLDQLSWTRPIIVWHRSAHRRPQHDEDGEPIRQPPRDALGAGAACGAEDDTDA